MEAVVGQCSETVEAEAVEEGILGAEAEVARVTGQAVAAAVASLEPAGTCLVRVAFQKAKMVGW